MNIPDPLTPIKGSNGVFTTAVRKNTLPKTEPSTVTPPPPEGFVIDQPSALPAQSTIPPPPPGFVLDTVSAPSSPSNIPAPEPVQVAPQSAGAASSAAFTAPPANNWKDAIAQSFKTMSFLPFSDATQLSDAAFLLNAARKVERGEATYEDEEMLNDYLQKAQRDKTAGYQIVQGIMKVPAFAAELGLTAGAYTAGKTVTMNALKKALGKYAETVAGRAASRVGGLAAQTAASSAQRVATGTIQNVTPTYGLNLEEGEETFKITKDQDPLVKALSRSFAEQALQVGSERVGNLIDKTPPGKVFQAALRRYLKINPGKRAEDFMDMVRNKGLRNSFVSETIEEEIIKPVEVLTGVGTQLRGEENTMENRLKEQYSWKQFFIQSAVLAVPGAGGVMMNKLFSDKPANDPANPTTEEIKERIKSIGIPEDMLGDFPDRMATAKTQEERDKLVAEFANQFKDVVPDDPIVGAQLDHLTGEIEKVKATAGTTAAQYFDEKYLSKVRNGQSLTENEQNAANAEILTAIEDSKAGKSFQAPLQEPVMSDIGQPPAGEVQQGTTPAVEPISPPPTPTTPSKVETPAPAAAGVTDTQLPKEARVGAVLTSPATPTNKNTTPVGVGQKPITSPEVGAGITLGTETKIHGTKGQEYDANYAVVPRSELVASHDGVSFGKNPDYPLENARDYTNPAEQAKVLAVRNEFSPDRHVTDSTDASVGPVMVAGVTDEKGVRRLVVLGGNNREMAIQTMAPKKRQALADFTNERAGRFGVKGVQDADHELVRFMGEFDLRQSGTREKLQEIIDGLNPSPGKVQNQSEMAAVDAGNIPIESLDGVEMDMDPRKAAGKVMDLIAGGHLDRNLRSQISEHPDQSLEYLRRVMVNVAFRDRKVADFVAGSDTKSAAARGLVEAATPAVVELRRKGQNELADAFSRTMATIADYVKKGDDLRTALQRTAQQLEMDPKMAIIMDVADVMRRNVALSAKGKVIAEDSIENFNNTWSRINDGLRNWYSKPDMFGTATTADDVIRNVLKKVKEELSFENGEVRVSKVNPKSKGPFKTVKVKQAQYLVDEMMKEWKNKPMGGAIVVQNESDMDDLILSDESRQEILNSNAEGFYHIPSETVVIIADNLQRPSDAIRVMLHESIGHYGIRKVLGKEFEKELERIGKLIPADDLARAKKLYGEAVAIEEYLANEAPTRNPTLWQEFIKAVREALKRIGVNDHILDKWDTRGEIDKLIDTARDWMERGEEKPTTGRVFKANNATITAPGAQGVRMMVRAFHGTPHTFEPEEGAPLGKFKKEKVGTGEGAAAYGWGVAYVAEEKAVAEGYKSAGLHSDNVARNQRAIETSESNIRWLQDIKSGKQSRPKTNDGKPMSDERIARELRENQDIIDQAKAWKEKNTPNLYHVEIDADPKDFLDWDKPLNEQSEKIKKILTDTGYKIESRTGGDLYNLLSAEIHTPEFRRSSDPQLASEHLASLGIKGIRYADQGSRQRYSVVKSGDKWQVIDVQVYSDTPPVLISEHASKVEAQAAADKQQTSNYVVFNESDIRVVGRNGEVLKPSEAMTGETRMSKPGEDTRQFKLETVTPDQLRSEATLKKQNEEARRRTEELQKRMAAPIKGNMGETTGALLPGEGNLFRFSKGEQRETDVHKFSDRVAEDNRMMAEVRKALEFQEYNVLHNKDVIEAAKARLDKSVSDAYTAFVDPKSDMKSAERVVVGQMLMQAHNEAARTAIQAKDKEMTKTHLNRAIDIGHKLDEYGLEYGQGVQAFTNWNETLSTAEGAQRMFERNKGKFVDMVLNKSGKDIEAVQKIVQEENTKAIDETLIEERVQERINTILDRLGSNARNGLPDRMKAKAGKQAAQDYFSRPENAATNDPDLRFSKTGEELDKKLFAAAKYGARVMWQNGNTSFAAFSDAMIKNSGPNIEKYLPRIYNEASILLNNIVSRKPVGKGADTRNIRSANAELKAILKQWFAGDPNAEREPVIDLLKAAGMTEREAISLTMSIQHKFIERAQKAKTRKIQQILSGRIVPLSNQKAIRRLVELSNLTSLSDPVVREAIARAYNLPALTPEIASKLDELANIIKDAPEGFQQEDATRSMLNYMRKQMPPDVYDIGWSMWYANILSGYQTAERNFLGNAWNAMDNLATSMIVEPRNAPFALWGFVRGINAGVQGAANVLKTGNFPARGNKYEMSSSLELNPFTGIFKVFNAWKFVMRSLYAADMLFFKPAQESRTMMIAADLARKEGVSGRDLWRRASEIMGKTSRQKAAFRQQAGDEGLTGFNIKMREQEIAEQQRPGELTAEAMDYAQRVTFNYQPEGQLGVLARGISNMSMNVPVLRFAVPFTRIVANVANTTIDHTPWGFVRAYRGMKNESGDLQAITGHRRAQLLAKATMGTVAMTTLYLLDRMGDDDDDKKKIAIYGRGPSDTSRRYQLEETGWKPYTIRIGKHYFDYRLTPLAVPFAIVGNMRDAERWKKMDQKSIQSRAAFAVLMSSSTIFDMSFLSGVNQLVTMLQRDSVDSAAAGVRSYISRTAGTLIPALLKQIDRTFDENIRDNSTIQEALLREVPIASHYVKPKINLLGEPVRQTAGYLSILGSTERSDPVWRLVVDKEAWISKPATDTKVGDSVMTEDEYYQYVKESGEIIRERIEDQLPRLQKLDKEIVGKIIDDITQTARNRIKYKIRNERRKK